MRTTSPDAVGAEGGDVDGLAGGPGGGGVQGLQQVDIHVEALGDGLLDGGVGEGG